LIETSCEKEFREFPQIFFAQMSSAVENIAPRLVARREVGLVAIDDESCRRCSTDACARSALCRRTHRRAGRLAHLDAGHAVPSASAYARHGRWAILRWFLLGEFEKLQVPRSCPCSIGDLSREVLRSFEKGWFTPNTRPRQSG